MTANDNELIKQIDAKLQECQLDLNKIFDELLDSLEALVNSRNEVLDRIVVALIEYIDIKSNDIIDALEKLDKRVTQIEDKA